VRGKKKGKGGKEGMEEVIPVS